MGFKRTIRSGLREALDKDAAVLDQDRCLAFFDGKCAYCGVQLPEKGWHLDHVQAEGTNQIGNRVPSCAPCNSGAKQAKPVSTVASPERLARIDEWRLLNPCRPVDFELLRRVQARVLAVYDAGVAELKAARQ